MGNSALFRLVSSSDPCKYPSPQSAMTSPDISSRASFDFGHGFDLHCVLFGRLGSGVPGYTRIFLGEDGVFGMDGIFGRNEADKMCCV